MPVTGAAPLLRSTGLLIRLRLRRLANQIAAGATRKKAADGKRTGNPGKRASRVVMFVFMPLGMLWLGGLAREAIVNLHYAIDPPGAFWLTAEFSAPLVVGVAFLLAIFWLASLLLSIASGELAKPDWDLEWLITLPVRSDTLLWARILERSIVNPSGVMALLPACTVIAWYSGFRWSALLVGALAAWPLLLLAALARTLLDTGLRLRMSAARLRNLHAVISVLSIVTMYLAFSMGMKGKSNFMFGIAAAMPGWLAWTPVGLVVRALNERGVVDSLLFSFAALAQIALILWLGVRVLGHLLRHGVVAGGARDTARAPAVTAKPAADPAVPTFLTRHRLALRPVQRRELTLLSRDRNFLVQSLVLPLLVVGGQLIIGTSGAAGSMWSSPNAVAGLAFGLAAYSLSMSAFQTLNTEGHALWLLYTFPCSIEDVLLDKAKLWGVLTLVYPAAIFAVGAVLTPELDWQFIGAALTAFLGIPIYAFIAVALGVFGSNPLEQHQNQKVKTEYMFLYLGLSGMYAYAIVTTDPWQRLVFIVLTLLLAVALWQKARDHLGYLLDPDVSPPPRVSTSDGLIAAMVFFVLQAVALAIISRGRDSIGAALVAYTIAGGLTYALMRYVYARSEAEGVPRFVAPSPRLQLGLLGGLAAACAAAVYLLALAGTDLLPANAAESYSRLGTWALLLALVAAPVFEEFIFRGLIFGGLRRSFGAWPAALASAAIFTIVHPTVSALPVFVMGVCAAFVYERSRSLLAPIITHVIYNAGVIAVQHFLL